MSAPELRLSEVLGALSVALDVTEGLPPGHALRTCLIGMRLADAVGHPAQDREALFHALLLKDAGCSANASRVALLAGRDDLAVKREARTLQGQDARFTVPPDVGRQLRELATLRCERGADVALMLGLPRATAEAIRALDEHWDGGGVPAGLAEEAIPPLARIMGLAQAVEVAVTRGGVDAGLEVARSRRGTWFEPALVDALLALRDDPVWALLAEGDTRAAVAAYEPPDLVEPADEARLDRVAEAFARIIDAKSPYTARHSARVARLAVAVGAALDFAPRALRDLRRAALLHDIGKLGVPSTVLDKPSGLEPAEWAAMRRHPELTFRILRPVAAFGRLAAEAAAHHERLDGRGYHLGLAGERLSPAARVLAVADVLEALTADRPYRGPLPLEEALALMRRDAGAGLDPEALAVLAEHVEALGLERAA